MHYSQFRRRSFTVLQPHYHLSCGSEYELPRKYCASNPTDRDYMYYCHDICAIPQNRNPPKGTKCTLLRIDSTQTPPGFVRLMTDKNNKYDEPTYYRRPSILKQINTVGPSIKSELKYTNTLPSGAQSQDAVFSVYCPYWPVEVEEWRNRKRFHGWPNEKLIARITRGGCHFVSKLRTRNSCDDTEWRFSFSKAELLLIHSWTDVQKHIYHAIRIIKKDISVYCGDDEQENLQTYYFKTLMFWACEEFPPTFWSERNMNNCVGSLLRRFLKCLDEKYCPSYFIPECNIMSDLRDKEAFGKKFQVALNLCKLNKIIIPISLAGSRCSDLSFHCECAYSFWLLTPLNEELNGRFGQYFSECEWFLPEMKNIHAAIDANLRLMTIDNATSRKNSNDYAVCLENLEFALSGGNYFISRRHSNAEQSAYEYLNEIFIRQRLRNSICIYRRCRNKDDFDEGFRESPLHCVASAYRANIFFTAMESCNESLNECYTCFDLIKKMETGCNSLYARTLCSLIPILICNSLARIYDEHLQVILGFATLHRNISSSESPNPSTAHEVCLKLDAFEFLKYLFIQSEHKLSIKRVMNIHICYSYSDDRQSCMSQLVDKEYYSAAILFAALRQSRAYMKPLTGDLLPHCFRRSEINEEELRLLY